MDPVLQDKTVHRDYQGQQDRWVPLDFKGVPEPQGLLVYQDLTVSRGHQVSPANQGKTAIPGPRVLRGL